MKLLILSVIVEISFSYVLHDHKMLAEAEDEFRTVGEIISKYGYPFEAHQVITSDGYILTLHRISHGRNQKTVNKKVILMQHGILSSSIDWIITGPTTGLGYIMADEGYDVWLGNARGNTFSRNHTTLNPDSDAQFWDFSWHEIGIYDLPATIDYMLTNTSADSIYYVGHSQGTTSFYVMNSMKPKYNHKIKAHVSLAPIGYMGHARSPALRFLSVIDTPLEWLLPFMNLNEWFPTSRYMAEAGNFFCEDGDVTQLLCTNSMFIICGYSPSEMNATFLPILMGHTPAGSSTKQFLHYGQEVGSGYFRQFDYEEEENRNRYGSSSPPNYDLSQITAPIYMLYSHNDLMAAEVDVNRLCEELPNCVEKILVSDGNFNHLDYLYGIHASTIVYNNILPIFEKH